ncbi:hypothetical protein FACS1894190_12200 [Spirochaetia bacterium]|nr:hypothetical protein FACS1894190_12200 [Spirochaetia bacterium]
MNPALTAPLQRVSAALGWTGLIQTRYGYKFGDAFFVGALLPTRFGVWTATFNGSFIPVWQLPYGNSFVGRVGWSRDLTDNIFLGASIYSGGLVGDSDSDWALAADLGFTYVFGDWSIFKNMRASAVAANLGKNFNPKTGPGEFPSIATLKLGFASLFVETGNFTAGFSFDVGFPSFQNFTLGFGVDMKIIKIITVSVGWDMNTREIVRDMGMNLPFIGISVNWTANTGKSGLMTKQGWQTTDFAFSGLWQQNTRGLQTVSVGAQADFGGKDTDAPEIIIGD